jgi:hypothetical protein
VTKKRKLDPKDELQRWEELISTADIQSVPLNYIETIKFNMIDGTVEFLEVAQLKKTGLKITDIKVLLDNFLDQQDDRIDCLDFVVDVKAVKKTISQKTKRLLG